MASAASASASAASASASTCLEITNDRPVLNLINKRLRALRKKLNRISQMEDSRSKGKKLNKEQEETLRSNSKSDLLAAVDELEKLKQPLLQAVAQEIELALEKNKQKPDSVVAEEVAAVDEKKAATNEDAAVSDLLNLLYFSSVFDVRTIMRAQDNMLTRTHERNCCLSYDYVPDDEAAWDPLKELDLDLIAMLGGVLTSRPVNSSLSHKNALKQCVEHAKLWLANADQRIEPDSDITYAGLKEKLNKIMASDYFTTTPEIKAAVEVAAAAGGNYTSFQAPVQVSVEGSGVEYQQVEEQSPNSLDTEGYVYVEETGHVAHVDQHNQGEIDVENKSELPTQTTEQGSPDTEVDSKEQYASPKSFRSGRGGGGGGRRGYSNGRGRRVGNRSDSGGGYQNGRSGQAYDQAGGYYPSNNYRGRGGRGGNYNHYAPAGHSGQAQEAS
ncbi:hypothetical protein CASFOL_020845 [Castilleja foliolosa]|uniref:Glycine-rich protein n=1 Tax=Castilleja foliolosa TaxID=1961234 RepID=A0ABD3D211_9LAMI